MHQNSTEMHECRGRRLIDDYTKEVLWDFEKATIFTYPWARQGLRIVKDPPIGPPKAGDKLKILFKGSGETLVELGTSRLSSLRKIFACFCLL